MEGIHSEHRHDRNQSRKIVLACEDDFVSVKRPVCKYCAGRVTSKSLRWECVECGRQFLKVYLPTKKRNNPKCIECESENVISRGDSWSCNDCGRKWKKVYRIKQ